MKINQIGNSLYQLKIGYVSLYLIKGEGEWALVDTGIANQGKNILGAMDKADLKGPINHIILTHLHHDHTGSLNELKKLTGARLYAHEKEADGISQGQNMRPCVPAPGLLKKMIHRYLLKGGRPTFFEKGTPIDTILQGGELLPLGPGVEVIHTPGHTTGHICLLLKEEGGTLIVGDAASGGKTPQDPMLFEEKEAGYESLKLIGTRKFDKAVFGHGKAILSGASERFRQIYN
jgi:glyoxylase-like metal-dependent hydrolase (beta-lactamase superfamily II)